MNNKLLIETLEAAYQEYVELLITNEYAKEREVTYWREQIGNIVKLLEIPTLEEKQAMFEAEANEGNFLPTYKIKETGEYQFLATSTAFIYFCIGKGWEL